MKALSILLLLLSFSVQADSPILVDPETGKLLGNLNSNRFDPNSVSNEFGRYGSEYSSDSINNKFGRYGSEYSQSSPSNPYATGAPIIIER